VSTKEAHQGYIHRTIRPVLGTVKIRKLGPDRQNPARLVHGRVAVDQFAGGTVDVMDAATQSGHVSQDEGLKLVLSDGQSGRFICPSSSTVTAFLLRNCGCETHAASTEHRE
jgi:hypothetical protein